MSGSAPPLPSLGTLAASPRAAAVAARHVSQQHRDVTGMTSPGRTAAPDWPAGAAAAAYRASPAAGGQFRAILGIGWHVRGGGAPAGRPRLCSVIRRDKMAAMTGLALVGAVPISAEEQERSRLMPIVHQMLRSEIFRRVIGHWTPLERPETADAGEWRSPGVW